MIKKYCTFVIGFGFFDPKRIEKFKFGYTFILDIEIKLLI
jgi:hypothetical protein